MCKRIIFKLICEKCSGNCGYYEQDHESVFRGIWTRCAKCRGTGFFGTAVISADDIEEEVAQYLESTEVRRFDADPCNLTCDLYIRQVDQLLLSLPKCEAEKLLSKFVPSHWKLFFRKHCRRCYNPMWCRWSKNFWEMFLKICSKAYYRFVKLF